ncbi:digestive cysteine proteinase 1-like [Culicoides brevitarsis]|uniref:digestive cysteine proteinase 1-like n=1 Tax=Culicoides brevitarsis TaxID=469753 RepID=UPI00307CABDA
MNLPLLLLILGVSQKENQQWEEFKMTYNKNYESLQEETYRRAIFLENLKKIEAHNEKYVQGLETFEQGIDQFSDMKEDEFKLQLLGSEKRFEELDETAGNSLELLEQEALEAELNRKWKEFKMTHEKEYETLEEEVKRKEIFDFNVRKMEEHNKRYHQGLETFYMGINQFTDLTSTEFRDKYLNFIPLNATIYNTVEESFVEEDEEPIKLTSKSYWYTKDIPIKNQEACGSCWAFSVTGVLEYAYYHFQNRKLVSLSEQELVDCDHRQHGCNGGVPYYAFQWVKQNGINFENEYPYQKHQGQCRRKRSNVGPKIIKSVGFTGLSEREMFDKLQNVGPIQVAVCADRWQGYRGGYFTAGNCNGHGPNHAVVAVGAANVKGKDVW